MIYLSWQMDEIIEQLARCIVMDTETTALDGEIVDLTLIDGANGAVLFNRLLRPAQSIEDEAMQVHHITNAMVANEPTFAEVWPELDRVIAGRVIITYNAQFDGGRLAETAHWANMQLPYALNFVCLMQAYARYWGAPNRFGNPRRGPAWQKLGEACEQQGVVFEGTTHRALSDCRAAYTLIRTIAERHIRGDAPLRFVTARSVAEARVRGTGAI